VERNCWTCLDGSWRHAAPWWHLCPRQHAVGTRRSRAVQWNLGFPVTCWAVHSAVDVSQPVLLGCQVWESKMWSSTYWVCAVCQGWMGQDEDCKLMELSSSRGNLSNPFPPKIILKDFTQYRLCIGEKKQSQFCTWTPFSSVSVQMFNFQSQ
jgi:hypothetical protein